MRVDALPTVTDPLRVGPGFAPTVTTMVALPTPEAGVAPPTQLASLRTDHEQPSVAVRSSETSWFLSSRFTVDGETSNRHAAAACATLTVCSATTRRPRRGTPLGLGAALYLSVAAPCPLAGLSDIHDSCTEADHGQSRVVFTATVPLPPAAGSSAVSFVTEISHLLPVGPTKLVLLDPHALTATATAAKTML